MQFLHHLQDQFLDEDPEQTQKSTTKQMQFGPWVLTSNTSKQNKNNHLPQTARNEIKYSQAEGNHKSKTSDRRRISFFKDEQLTENQCQSNKDFIERFHQRRTLSVKYPLPDEENLKASKKVNLRHEEIKKVPLTTTMYIYYTNKKKNDKGRNSSTASDTLHHFNFTESHSNPKHVSSSGARNLQRLLKVKQKMRIKNSVFVRKIKEKNAHSVDNVMSPNKIKEQLDTLQQKTWVSTTLKAEHRIEVNSARETSTAINLKDRKLSRFRQHKLRDMDKI